MFSNAIEKTRLFVKNEKILMFISFIKKLALYSFRFSKVMLKKFHKRNPKLITYPTYLSCLVIVIFIITAYQKDIFSKDMNEIGDSLAGFAGVLAFLWIIVTALLQNRDLKLQYAEIKGMKKANESQARSLRSAEVFKLLEYVDYKLESLEKPIAELRNQINEEIRSFIGSYDTGRNKNASFQPDKDLAEVWGYFLKDVEEAELYYSLDSVRSDFDYEAYLKLETIVRKMGHIHSAIDALTKNADKEIKEEVLQSIASAEQILMVDFYRKWRPILIHVERVVKHAIVKYEIGNIMARTVIELSLRNDSAEVC